MNARPTFDLEQSRSTGPLRPTPYPIRDVARTLRSAELFNGDREIGIDHHGALYRLKITRQGKLILNK